MYPIAVHDQTSLLNLLFYGFTWKANRKLQAQMNAMIVQQKKGRSFGTPPPSVAAPSPGCSPAKPVVGSSGSRPKPGSSKAAIVPDQRPAPVTEGAKLNRLRRLCERKPSGRCLVPDSVHEKWRTGGKEEREALIEELERCNWSKDCFHKPPIMLWYMTSQ